jgi:hypothetical protein
VTLFAEHALTKHRTHARQVLWLNEADTARAASEISATVPAEWDADADDWVVPSDPEQARLLRLVLRKQMHRCSDVDAAGGCRERHPQCRYGFPYDPHLDHEPLTDEAHRKILYYRLRYQDRNVVPFHAALLLLWGAHLNVQLICRAAW